MIFKFQWCTWPLLMAVSCVGLYIIFKIFNHTFFLSNTQHNKTTILRNQNTDRVPTMKLAKNLFFFIISAILRGFCYLFWFKKKNPCFWKWLMGFPDQQKSWLVSSTGLIHPLSSLCPWAHLNIHNQTVRNCACTRMHYENKTQTRKSSLFHVNNCFNLRISNNIEHSFDIILWYYQCIKYSYAH